MSLRFPVDAPKNRVLKTLIELGFEIVREGNHISMSRKKKDGTFYSAHTSQSQYN